MLLCVGAFTCRQVPHSGNGSPMGRPELDIEELRCHGKSCLAIWVVAQADFLNQGSEMFRKTVIKQAAYRKVFSELALATATA